MANLFDTSSFTTTEPLSFTAGDRVAWTRVDIGGDYPPASYSLSYTARKEGAGTVSITATASASGSNYQIIIPASTTANYSAGRYHWQMYIKRTSDNERITLDSGAFIIQPNKATATTDPRSNNKVMLDAIDALLDGRATKDQMGYSIAGRSITRIPLPDLMVWRDRYAAKYVKEVRMERIKTGLGQSGIIKARFV